MIRAGDTIKARTGTTTDLFAEGREGVVAEVRDPKPYSGNNSNNLVRWGNDSILMGFTPSDVFKVGKEE